MNEKREDREMNTINQVKIFALLPLIFLLPLTSCMSILQLNVNYRLPPATDTLRGKKVFLAFDDKRSKKEMIGPGAREAFRNVSENFSLSLARGTDTGFKLGIFEVPSLFTEIFKRRLEQEGVEVVTTGGQAEIEMWILLEDFFLDLVDKTWKVRMAYEGRLIRDGDILSRQKISGEAERLKLIGQKEADKMLGEFFTDAVNRLDVARLLQQSIH